MEGIAKPPTDNLYKFMAIAGVAMILGAVYLLVNVMRETQGAYQTYNASTGEWIHEAQSVDVGFERLSDRYSRLLTALMADGKLDESEATDLATELAPRDWLIPSPKQNDLESLREFFHSANGYVTARGALEKTVTNLNKIEVLLGNEGNDKDVEVAAILEDCMTLEAQLDVTVEKWEALRSYFAVFKAKADWLSVSKNVMNFLAFAGVIIASAGFWLWYKRVQIPLDSILSRDAKLALKSAGLPEDVVETVTFFVDGHFEHSSDAQWTDEQDAAAKTFAESLSPTLIGAGAAPKSGSSVLPAARTESDESSRGKGDGNT